MNKWHSFLLFFGIVRTNKSPHKKIKKQAQIGCIDKTGCNEITDVHMTILSLHPPIDKAGGTNDNTDNHLQNL